jgi:aminoglycoside phosphotransferase (APT) family kinase protein
MTEQLAHWLDARLGWRGDLSMQRFGGGNSNQTYLLRCGGNECVLRRPPHDPLSPSAHSVAREHRLLSALNDTPVRAPRAVALCEDASVIGAPFVLMEMITDAVPLTDTLPEPYGDDTAATLASIGDEAVDALAELHTVDWRAAGLHDFGRPENFLERQVPRWRRQYESYQCRELPRFAQVAAWLESHRPHDQPPDQFPAILHGDMHLDNSLYDAHRPLLRAIVDWEMATIGDPLLDLGLLLGFWGPRPIDPCAIPEVQAITRTPAAPTRAHLTERYAQSTGRDVQHIDWYIALALWKLAAIVEGAYAQHLDGRLRTPYTQRLEHDVPLLLEEAAHHAGIAA